MRGRGKGIEKKDREEEGEMEKGREGERNEEGERVGDRQTDQRLRGHLILFVIVFHSYFPGYVSNPWVQEILLYPYSEFASLAEVSISK